MAYGPWPGVVLTHPHPLYGGTKDVPLMVALAAGLTRGGFVVLRFNFRGVGHSEGTFSPDERVVSDVAAATTALLAHPEVDATRCGLVGYSFGAWVGLRHFAADGRLQAFAAIGMPLWDQSPAWFRDDGRPRLFVTGDGDDISPADAFRPLLMGTERARLDVISGADHFYRPPHEETVVTRVVAFLAEALAPPP
ncbi:MAG: CocE/NonD family hydrolase [Ardenticatenia bacterium]|nr:CocE/NonD family hydrolase [Ardenticatenia bacterium]